MFTKRYPRILLSFSPKIFLKVLTQEKRRRRGTEDIGNKIYDEGVGCGSTNQQL